jgi:hypothetical protein
LRLQVESIEKEVRQSTTPLICMEQRDHSAALDELVGTLGDLIDEINYASFGFDRSSNFRSTRVETGHFLYLRSTATSQ